MSAVDEVRRETDRGSSVKLVRNARGETQIEVKAYSDDEPMSLDYAAAEAQRVYDLLVAKYGSGA